MATAGGKVLKTDLDAVLTTLNKARNKWGLASTTLSNFGVGYSVQSSHMSTIVTGLNQAISKSGAPVVTTDLPSYAVGQLIKASLLELIKTKATTVYNYCSCNCNYCSCDCNRCSCNCDRCTCNCDNCTCDCNYCSCDCNYCSCDCNYCSCNCNKCTCDCNRCTCDCNYCSCDCDDCSCDCDRCSCDCDRCCDYCTESNDDANF